MHAGKLPDDLVRLSIGIEDPADLIADLAQAFELAAHPHVTDVRSVRRKDTAEEREIMAGAGGSVAAAGGGGGEKEEDAAAIARVEVARLTVMVKYLKERLADSEARTAEFVSQRVLIAGTSGAAAAGADGGAGSSAASGRGGAGAGDASAAATLSAAMPLYVGAAAVVGAALAVGVVLAVGKR
jgi:hypothetical protein